MAILLAAMLILAAGQANATGFQFVEIPASDGNPPIEAAVWYPTGADSPAAPNTPFGQALALRAPIAGEKLPLVVISHGDGGWFGGHATLAREIADAGMIAVALNHPGNSDGDETATPARWIAERPRHLARVVDFMRSEWAGSGHVDPGRIGAFGYSAGGHSVLVAGGAEVSHSRIATHCTEVPDEFVCRTGMAEDIVGNPHDFPPAIPGLRSVVAAAPGFVFGFDPDQIASLDIAIQIWSAAEDERVPHETNAGLLASALDEPSAVHVVTAAGHFAFRPPCNPALEQANPRIWQMACVDAPGFDRSAFQQHFNRAVVSFLSDTLSDDDR